MDEEWVDVADAEITRRHALPACPSVAADAETGDRLRAAIGRRRRAVKFARVVSRHQDPVRVRIDAVDGGPRFAAVPTAQKTAHFDCDIDGVGILRMKSNALRVRQMGRTGKSPFLYPRHLAQAGKLGPAFAEIVAVVEMRWLHAGVYSRFAIHHLRRQRIDFLLADATVAALPGLAQIGAEINLAAIGATEQRFGRRLEDDRAEMLSRHHGFLLRPGTAIFLEGKYSPYRADQHLVFLRFTASQRLPTWR